jgi:hypothetical protein
MTESRLSCAYLVWGEGGCLVLFSVSLFLQNANVFVIFVVDTPILPSHIQINVVPVYVAMGYGF